MPFSLKSIEDIVTAENDQLDYLVNICIDVYNYIYTDGNVDGNNNFTANLDIRVEEGNIARERNGEHDFRS